MCRGKKRKEFLSQITLAGQTSGLQCVEALEVAVSVIQKVHQLQVAVGRGAFSWKRDSSPPQDAVEFGSGKECCVSLALLETSPLCLKYHATSPSSKAHVVGQKLHQSHKQVFYLAS